MWRRRCPADDQRHATTASTDDAADGSAASDADATADDAEVHDAPGVGVDGQCRRGGSRRRPATITRSTPHLSSLPRPTRSPPTRHATHREGDQDHHIQQTRQGKQGREPCPGVHPAGPPPTPVVTLGLGTLAGLDDLPGTLAGFGAIPAGLARSIADSAGTINALLTNPDTGTITAAGALTYRPTQELRDQIAAILNVCQFPSCRQPVWRCDNDHRETFNHEHPEQGGETSLSNNGPFCRRHHLIKHHSEWKVRPDPDRTVLHFTSPTGHHYTKRGRQAAPPAMWITTAGTAIAERLDTITATAEVNRPPNPAQRCRRIPQGHADPARPEHQAHRIPARRHHLGQRHRTMERPTTVLNRRT